VALHQGRRRRREVPRRLSALYPAPPTRRHPRRAGGRLAEEMRAEPGTIAGINAKCSAARASRSARRATARARRGLREPELVFRLLVALELAELDGFALDDAPAMHFG